MMKNGLRAIKRLVVRGHQKAYSTYERSGTLGTTFRSALVVVEVTF